MSHPEEIIAGSIVTLRRFVPGDADQLLAVVTGAQEHLRPWQAWADADYDADTATAFLAQTQVDWETRAAFAYAVTVDGAIAGACSLMRRIGPGGGEIGYWLHPDFVGRGAAREAAALLVDAAFRLGMEYVEIVHDTANVRSGAIPRVLGFTEIARVSPPQEPLTSGEDGVDVRWRLTREDRR